MLERYLRLLLDLVFRIVSVYSLSLFVSNGVSSTIRVFREVQLHKSQGIKGM